MFIIVQYTVKQIVISIFDQISQRCLVWLAAHSPGIVLCGGYNYYSTGVLQLIKGQ